MNDQENIRVWKNKLYQLQQDAPQPIPVPCKLVFSNRAAQYGSEYHGPITRQETDQLLGGGPTGSYLIRCSQRAENAYTLVIKFDDEIKNYKLYYDYATRQHYVGQKMFDTVWDLVADGLIHLYVETRGKDELEKISSASNYESSPYYQARYYTIQSRTQNLRRAVARRDSRLIHHLHSPTFRRQSFDSGSISAASSPSGPGSAVISGSSTTASCHNTPQHQAHHHTTSSHIAIAPPVPPHAALSSASLSSAASSPLQQQLQRPGSGGSSSDSIASPAVASRRRHSKEDVPSSRFINQSPLTDVSSISGSGANSENVPLISDANHNISSHRVSPREQLLLSAGARRTTGSGGNSSPLTPSTTSSGKFDEVCGVARPGPVRTVLAPSQSLAERYNLPTEVDVSQLEKAHNLKTHTFKGPHWCDFCTHFMWGLVAQGVKCTDCGFQAHKKCSERAPADCLPDMKRLKRVFGVELTGLVKAENRSVPQVLVKCVSEIERRNGLQMEGLYRVAGFHDHVEDIKMAFDRDCESVDISTNRYEDVTILTSVVKLFLRQLPIPLITYDAYPDFISAVKEERIPEEQRINLLQDALAKLPPAHYQTLKYIMAHLFRVAESQDINMMTPENLAIVLAPTILTSPDCDPMTTLLNAQSERAIIEYLIVDFYQLFT